VITEPLLYEASMDWCPDFPRQAVRNGNVHQSEVTSRVELKNALTSAEYENGPGYVSVYSFPRGHSTDGNIPQIDTVFFDLDIPKSEGDYDPQKGGKQAAWRRDMSRLLVRARMVADIIMEQGLEDHFRVAYSGHKGIHLYIDFEPLSPELGSLQKYKNGISNYAEELIDYLAGKSGIEIRSWMDVTSHDLGRLARHPNTPHHGAQHVDWTPHCVPGSIEELSDLHVDDYLEATTKPRSLRDTGRTQSERAKQKLTEHIKDASDSQTTSTPGTSSHRNEEALEEYRSKSNDEITVGAVETFLIQNRPCIEPWVNSDDAYEYGHSSRKMEINVMKHLASNEVPIDVIVAFFSDIPRFDEEYTRALVEDIIARYHPSSFCCSDIITNAQQFCLDSDCSVYRRNDDLQKE